MTYTLRDLLPIALIMAVAIIATAISADVVSDVQQTEVTNTAGCNATVTTSCGTAYDVSEFGLEGLLELGSWFPTIALVIAAAIIIGILVMSFAYGRT